MEQTERMKATGQYRWDVYHRNTREMTVNRDIKILLFYSPKFLFIFGFETRPHYAALTGLELTECCLPLLSD